MILYNFFISCDINYNNSLSKQTEIQIFRIIQEALNNIIKYAQRHASNFTFNDNNNYFFLVIKDNGIGFNLKEKIK